MYRTASRGTATNRYAQRLNKRYPDRILVSQYQQSIKAPRRCVDHPPAPEFRPLAAMPLTMPNFDSPDGAGPRKICYPADSSIELAGQGKGFNIGPPQKR